jgi:serine/threonine-protein kinase RsbT
MGVKIIPVVEELDIVTARQAAREISRSLGFSLVDQTRITTAISELARNIVLYATAGTISIRTINTNKGLGIEIIAEDQGPGIVDVDKAMEDGFSTSNGLGAGLPGVRRLMDEFELNTSIGVGTRIRVFKRLR